VSTTQEHPVSPHKQGQANLQLENPPVVETSVGFHFAKLEGWHLLRQGLLWGKFRPEYPELEILPMIVQAATPQTFQFDMNSPVMRTGFTDKSRTQLVQIQDGLLLHNWRKTNESPQYKRYDAIRSRLRSDWATFRAYLHEESLKDPVVLRCEMSYFNHLVRNEDWKDFADLSDTFTVWKGLPESSSYGTAQVAAFNVMHQLDSGTVNVIAQPGIRPSDGKEVIQFSLTSSVKPKSSDDEELFRCLDECHENARRAFFDFTTDKARNRWREIR
jgi:uncharacterized protein (TIGR04255 family)